MSENMNEDRGSTIIRVCIAMIVLPTIATALRIWSRAVTGGAQSTRQRFWWDDWMAFLALPFSIALCALAWAWTTFGLGKHITTIPLPELIKGFKLLYPGFLMYTAACFLARMSVLLFYLRVFGKNWKYKIPMIHLTIYLNIVQWLIVTIVNIFQCSPVHKAWDPLVAGHCIDTYKFYLGNSVIITPLDIVILLLPLPILWSLQLKPLEKVLMVGLFVCGYAVVAISIARLVVIVSETGLDEDITWHIVPELYCLLSEPAISIFSISIPAIYALVKRGLQHGPRALFTAKELQSLSSRTSSGFQGSATRKVEVRNVKPKNSLEQLFSNEDSEYITSTQGVNTSSMNEMDMEMQPYTQIPRDTGVE